MVVLLALLAACCFALAAAVQQRVASAVLSGSGPALRQAVRLIRTPLWLAGWAADACGFGLQAVAVHLGSLSLVQPLLVTTLLFSLQCAAVSGRCRIRARDWLAAAATCAGLAALCSTERAGATTSARPGLLVLEVLAVATIAAGSAFALRRRPFVLAASAGALFAVGAAMIKLAGDDLTSGGPAAALRWPVVVLAAASLSGIVLQQKAFALGSLPATMTALTIADPLVSYALGAVGFGEPLPHGARSICVALVASAVLIIGVCALTRSPLLRAAPTPHPSRVSPALAVA